MWELPEPQDDGLFIPKVKAQSLAKHHFLRRYIDAFTTAMKDKKWDGLHYIDLFAGAGIERVEGHGLDWGSPLIAAQSPFPFAQLHLCEKEAKRFGALQARLGRYSQPRAPQVINGDANVAVADVVKALPPRSLSLAFLDPYALHLRFATLQALAVRNVDFVIFFPDHLDALRNMEFVYRGDLDSNLDGVLGTSTWRERTHAAPQHKWAEVLGKLYTDQIRTLGYSEFEYERITGEDNRYLYKLIFCSRAKVGGTIWRRVAGMKPDGQRTFGFEG